MLPQVTSDLYARTPPLSLALLSLLFVRSRLFTSRFWIDLCIYDTPPLHTADWPCPLARFSQAVDMVRRLGKGCYMAKVDVQAAYRAIPIRPADWPLLGMHWHGQYFFHRTLPFG